ncbi:WD-40 repeat-containing protein [Reticulomyxa filosa]|uniref:WD-40 repeat-containing protein n=1 Tax=Reticulomyxa filosa TaxID=46433 RepID=X6LWB2_RETFI|nr:WD-40 repeat-containing protein [Reticulomyxa filosa]|eukprot:ETO05671.1 WD-40 repeat-containing protein [Reticulomyxa filosa]
MRKKKQILYNNVKIIKELEEKNSKLIQDYEKLNHQNKEEEYKKQNYESTTLSLSINFNLFRSSYKLINTFNGHNDIVYSIDYSTFDDCQFICSGSYDKTIRVWDINKNKQIQLFNKHLIDVYCVKFSSYHYYNNHCNVICSSSSDRTIRFWDFKHNKQLQVFNEHTNWVYGIEFSSFNGGRYLCSGSGDKTIRLWDIQTYKSLYIFNGHTKSIRCVDISSLQSNNNKNKMNDIGVIGGNGYTICSGSSDHTIRIWDIETTKQLIVFKGHKYDVNSVKYGSNELRHTNNVHVVEYLPFTIKIDDEVIGGNSNVICSGSSDNTIRFWDIRSNKKELYMIKGDENDNGITCLTFVSLKKKVKNNEQRSKDNYGIYLYYGSKKGPIRVWG